LENTVMITVPMAHERLRAAGLRLTPQRRALIDELVDDTSHPAADAVATRVAARVPGVSLSTVYKGLHELADLGLVRELDLPGSLRFDPNPTDHAHLLCSVCGAVRDVHIDEHLREELRQCPDGAVVESIDVVLHGTCPICAPGRAPAA